MIDGLGLILCFVCGCATSSNSNRYVLTVERISTMERTTNTIEITVSPSVPFAVQTKDQAGNQYRVNGRLSQKTNQSVHLDHMETKVQLSDGNYKDSCSYGSLDLELGQGLCWGELEGGVLWDETCIRVTKKR
jgi:hypothetical protein